MRTIAYLALLVGILSCNPKKTEIQTNSSPTEDSSVEERLQDLTERAITDLTLVPLDSLAIPRTITENGQLEGTKSKSWTSGFYPGMLWMLYDFSRDENLKQAAMQWSAFVEKEKLDTGTHDLGFKIYCPFGKAYGITANDDYKDIYVTAAQTLSTRYNPTIGAIRSWDFNADIWDFPVIIDNMMNLEMLFEATIATGDSTYYHIADTHATTTLANHFRPDNSSYHVVDYNPTNGEVNEKYTHQGYSRDSAWSRGQAWGLYGYTVAYRYTKDTKYLDQAKAIADYIFSHPNLPEDNIPYWDYDAPNIPDEFRDVSASAVTASGLLELSTHVQSNKVQYQQWANSILNSLETEHYQCDIPPYFLQHSVGSIPGEFEIDTPIIYAEYYYVEALMRRHQLGI